RKENRSMGYRIRQHSLLAGVLAFFCMTLALFGQVEKGTISAAVPDTTGASIVGAEVVVTNPSTGFEFKTVTSGEGQFVAAHLIPGTYKVVVTHAGFKTVSRGDLIVRPSQRLAVDLTLEVGEVTQTVEVTGELAPS